MHTKLFKSIRERPTKFTVASQFLPSESTTVNNTPSYIIHEYIESVAVFRRTEHAGHNTSVVRTTRSGHVVRTTRSGHVVRTARSAHVVRTTGSGPESARGHVARTAHSGYVVRTAAQWSRVPDGGCSLHALTATRR